MKRRGNLLKRRGPKCVRTVTRHPRTPVDLLLGTPCLPQQTFVRPLPSTSRPCAVDQRHQVIFPVTLRVQEHFMKSEPSMCQQAITSYRNI